MFVAVLQLYPLFRIWSSRVYLWNYVMWTTNHLFFQEYMFNILFSSTFERDFIQWALDICVHLLKNEHTQ